MRAFLTPICAAAILLVTTFANADVYILSLPEKSMDFSAFSEIAGPVLKKLTGPTDTFVVTDSSSGDLVSKVTFPDKRRYQNFTQRRKYALPFLREINAHLENRKELEAASEGPPVTLRLEQFTKFASTLRPLFPNEKIRVLLMANAIENDPRQKEFSMIGNMIPNDAHFKTGSFTSPFGTLDRPTAHKDVTFHWCYSEEKFANDLQRRKLARIWAVFLKRQGGNLATFTGDPKACLQRFLEASSTDYSTPLNPEHKVPKMIKVAPEPAAKTPVATVRMETPITTAAVSQPKSTTVVSSLPKSNVPSFLSDSAKISETAATNTVGTARVGTSWERACDPCDLDLHVIPELGAQRLYYGHTSSPEGKFHKDETSSPQSRLAFEYIDITKPLDVRDYKIWINFYRGKFKPGPRGTIRIELNGKTYEKKYHIPAGEGNEGKAFPTGRQWLEIDIADVLRLPRIGG